MSKELEQAELLFKQFKHKEAYPLFEKLADAGEARAMYFMGIYSRLYLGVGHFDQEKSYNWFKKGLEAGDVLCAISYGYLLPKEKRDAFMKEWMPQAENLAEAGAWTDRYSPCRSGTGAVLQPGSARTSVLGAGHPCHRRGNDYGTGL
mgnify:CR=1 FL=1